MMPKYSETSSAGEKRVQFHEYKTRRYSSLKFEDLSFMKTMAVAFTLMLSWSPLVSVSRADVAGPFPRPSRALPPYPRPTRSKTKPTASPDPAAASPSPSVSVSDGPSAMVRPGVTVAAVATGSLLGIVLIRKRKPQGGSR